MTKEQRDVLIKEIQIVLKHLERRVVSVGFAAAATLVPLSALADTFVVTSLDDSGVGTLREAVAAAEANPGADVVTFDPALTGTISLQSPLQVTASLSIQGHTGLSVHGGFGTVLQATGSGTEVLTIANLGVTGAATTGALVIDQFNLALDTVSLRANSSDSSGAGVNFAGGGGATLTVDSCTFEDNSSVGEGGAIFATGGDVTIRDSAFRQNSSAKGGAVTIGTTSHAVIERSLFVGNVSSNEGGAVVFSSAGGSIQNSTFVSNQSTAEGGTINVFDGGQVVTLDHLTLHGNTSGIVIPEDGHFTVSNSILANASNDIDFGSVSKSKTSPRISFNLIKNPSLVADATCIQGLEPMLGVLRPNAANTASMSPAPYSPAVNSGDPAFAATGATDQNGNPRVRDGRTDIGAVEVLVPRVFSISPVSSGLDCPQGGQRIDRGSDNNFDGQLQPDEIDTPALFVCTGAEGAKGATGSDGAPGGPGVNGMDGSNGATGADGAPGLPGANGKDGSNGANGADGQTGAKGGCNATPVTTGWLAAFSLWLRRRRSI